MRNNRQCREIQNLEFSLSKHMEDSVKKRKSSIMNKLLKLKSKVLTARDAALISTPVKSDLRSNRLFSLIPKPLAKFQIFQ